MIVAVVLSLVSCDDSVDGPDIPADEGGYITLRLKSTETVSRATEPDEDALNENLITSAVILLQPDGATDTDEATMYRRVDGIDSRTDATVNIRFTQTQLLKLFPDGSTRCRVYVAANLPAGTSVPDLHTIEALRKTVVEADFAANEPQSSFVMDGMSTAALTLNSNNPAKSSVSGTVNLERAASKIRLAVKVDSEVTAADGSKWTPQYDNMTVLIANGVRRSTVTPDSYTVTSGDYFSTTNSDENPLHRARMLVSGDNAQFPYELATPFYTYPNSWGDSDEKMVYMTLMVPWKRENENSYRTCYYMVPVMREGSAVVRNTSYTVNVAVGVLGSFTPDEPVLLDELSYRVIDWGKENLDVKVPNLRYLVVDQTDFYMIGERKVDIPFYSSHKTVVKPGSFKMKYYRYNATSSGLRREITISDTENRKTMDRNNGTGIYEYVVDNTIDPVRGSRTLSFDHELIVWNPYDASGKLQVIGPTGTTYPTEKEISDRINAIDYYMSTTDKAYSRYEIEFVLIHEDLQDDDGTPFQQKITIIQYPEMYIERVENQYGKTEESKPYGEPEYGNVYIGIGLDKGTKKETGIQTGTRTGTRTSTTTDSYTIHGKRTGNRTRTWWNGWSDWSYDNFEYVWNDGDLPDFSNLSWSNWNWGKNYNWGDTEWTDPVWTNHTETNDPGKNWAKPSGLTGGNRNPNMYIINVTHLSTTEYIIGDPRENEPYPFKLNYLIPDSKYGNPSYSPVVNGDISEGESVYSITGDFSIERVISQGEVITSGLGGRRETQYIEEEGTQTGRVTCTQYSSQIGSRTVTRTTNNVSEGAWWTAPHIDGTTGARLSNYYATDESDAKKSFIAPQLRVASSYGVSPEMSKDEARARCAGYQELNCPAGRWRLPTLSELEFIVKLSNDGKIPVLFSSDSNYWTAHGTASGKIGADNKIVETNRSSANVRCVYDEWYWEDKVPQDGSKYTDYNGIAIPYYPFTWGDRPR